MNLKIFATVHSLMHYTNLIDSCQAHLPVQYASNIELTSNSFAGSYTGVMIDSEPHLSCTCKTGLLAPKTIVAFLGINQFHRVGLRFVLVLLREHPKVHRKWFYGEVGNRTSCLLHWLSVSKMAVPLFHFTLRLNGLYNYILNTKLF